MSNPLPPVALSPAALGALQSHAAAMLAPAALEQDAPPKPISTRAEAPARRGKYLNILV